MNRPEGLNSIVSQDSYGQPHGDEWIKNGQIPELTRQVLIRALMLEHAPSIKSRAILETEQELEQSRKLIQELREKIADYAEMINGVTETSEDLIISPSAGTLLIAQLLKRALRQLREV